MEICSILLEYTDQILLHIHVDEHDQGLVDDRTLHMLSTGKEYTQESIIMTYHRTCALQLQHQYMCIVFFLFEFHVQQESEDIEYQHVQNMEKQQ